MHEMQDKKSSIDLAVKIQELEPSHASKGVKVFFEPPKGHIHPVVPISMQEKVSASP